MGKREVRAASAKCVTFNILQYVTGGCNLFQESGQKASQLDLMEVPQVLLMLRKQLG